MFKEEMGRADLFLDEWIKEKLKHQGLTSFSRYELSKYQLNKINETLAFAINNCNFYGKKYKEFENRPLKSLEEISGLPFTTPEELRLYGHDMICVSAGEISRIVTLNTSGSTGKPKRIFFTEEDQELTIDYFCHGMQNLVDGTDTVLILLPCKTPGNVGDLLGKGLERLGTSVVKYGFPDTKNPFILKELRNIIFSEGVTSIVGSPEEILCLAEYAVSKDSDKAEKHCPKAKVRSVLLSTDFVSDPLRQRISEIWGCKVFEHYGMTEMGLGGAASCSVLTGYHPRENDLYFEIINRLTGLPTLEGEWGEVVFTTLTRKAMPFIRYRTGDISRWIAGPCPCGSILKRMDKVMPREAKKGRPESSGPIVI
jgi:phenylacetate-coenzyme A ligase PaaK-like adenylate-forming protein